eukprot:Lithocolla_globosa_v1_NODE_5522_length_1227_cov_2.783276.p2 type:complete len:113 gc:universal NODE_5522_length_1227_cov_2.783276:522-184(-)
MLSAAPAPCCTCNLHFTCSIGQITAHCTKPANPPQMSDFCHGSCTSSSSSSLVLYGFTKYRSYRRELDPYAEKMMAFTAAALDKGAAIPRKRERTPPKDVAAEKREVGVEDV